MIPTYIFNKKDLQKAIKSCENNISALEIWNVTETDKLYFKNLFIQLRRRYRKNLIELNRTEKAKSIKTTYELVSNE